MKVLHINTLCTGGAAKAAIRLHKGLLQSGVDSRMLFLKQKPEDPLPGADVFLKDTPKSFVQKIRKRSGGAKSMRQKQQARLSGTKGRYEYVSFPLTDFRADKHPWIKEADLIHLHWIANFIDYPTFFKETHKPMVWTFHDKNPFLGMCHYRNDLDDNTDEFKALEAEYQAIKNRALSSVHDLTVVTPSESLGRDSARSGTFSRFPHRVISNAVDLDVFKPYDKTVARQLFALPEDKIVFLFVSENIENRWKGLDLLLDAVRSFETLENVVLCAAGRLNKELADKKLFSVGTIRDDRLMALLYSAADAFVLPTREDNLPNTMLESMACGTPVISFPVGGVQETVIHGMNGLLARAISVKSLQAELERYLGMRKTFNRQRIRQFAVEKFSLQKQADAYFRLYKSILAGEQINDHTS